MSHIEEFDYESLHDAESISAQLHALADGIASGELKLSTAQRAIALTPTGLLRLHIAAQRGRNRARLLVRISWRNPDEENEVRREILRIDAGQP